MKFDEDGSIDDVVKVVLYQLHYNLERDAGL